MSPKSFKPTFVSCLLEACGVNRSANVGGTKASKGRFTDVLISTLSKRRIYVVPVPAR
jgi:hypothetical protein